jgi:hypothetical protein
MEDSHLRNDHVTAPEVRLVTLHRQANTTLTFD